MNLLGSIEQMNAEDQAKLGKGSVRLQNAGVHKVSIKDIYTINDGKFPRLEVFFTTSEGLEAKATTGLKGKDWTTGEELPENKATQGYILNLFKAAFGDKCKQDVNGNWMLSAIAGAEEGTVTFKSGDVDVTRYAGLIGKELAIGTYTEFSSKGNTPDEKKKGKDVFRNQAVSMKDVFTKDLLSLAEVAEGKTEGVAHVAATDRLQKLFKPAGGFKDNKAVRLALKQAIAESKGQTAPVTADTSDSAGINDVEEVF